MAIYTYRNTGTNQIVHVNHPDFDGNPLWELVSGPGGGGGDVTQAELDALESDTTGPHGVADFADLLTDDEATAKVQAHNADSTAVHGITDTSVLETTTGAAAKVTAHAGASDPHGDRADATSKVSTHAAAVDPHADRAFATSAVSAHAAAVDPHSDRSFATLAIATHAGAADPHGDRAWATPLLANKVAKGELVLNVADHGAVGDGSTNDTAAIQAALTAAATGTRVVFPPGKNYSCTALTIANKTDLVIDGQGSKISWRATGARIGLTLTGTCANVTVRDLALVGNGVLADAHAGIYCGSGQSLSNIKILNNRVTDVTLGISFSADGSGDLDGILIEGNHIENVVGTTSGNGYGIHHSSSDTTTHQNVRIVGNSVVAAQRHSIYQAKGQGITIADNTIRDHRSGVANGSLLSAIMVARSGDVTVSGNTLTDGYDSAMTIGGVAGATHSRTFTVTGNVLSQAKDTVPLLVIGQQDPATEGFPDGLVITGNVFYSDTTAAAISLYSGKKVRIANNVIHNVVTSGTASAIRIGSLDESAGTADYTDDLVIESNSIYMATGGTKLPLNLSGIETTGINMRFANNRIVTPGNVFYAPVTSTNPNVVIYGQGATGLTGPFSTATSGDVAPRPRVTSVASSSTPTPNAVDSEQYALTALAANATFGVPTGTPGDGQPLLISIKDNGTARTLAWNAIYRAVGVALPTTTVISKMLYVGAIYRAADTKWDVIAVGQEV